MSGYDPPYPVYTDPNFPPPPASGSAPAPAYDPYGHGHDGHGHAEGTADYSNPQYYHNPPQPHDPFANPQWAHPVPDPHPLHQQDLGDYPPHAPLGPVHTNSYDSDPFASQHHLAPHSHQGHHDPTDDEPDSAPLLHNRWSTGVGAGPGGATTGHYPGQADASLGLPGAPGGAYDPALDGRVGGFRVDPDDQPIQGSVQYGSIPQRQPRRYKTVKRVQLYNGNLVLDCQVPPKLLERVPRKDDREFTHMRYTAVTCDPDEFLNERYSLRQILYETPRRTELFIVLTMYNEDEVLFCRTMHGVMKNIQHLCERNRSKTWGADGWKKVVVCIVSDGRAKINSRTLSVLAAMGVYQDGVAKNVVAGKPVTGHLYEYTTQVSIDPDLKMKSAERGIVPVQICFLLKEKNAKKINSHRWFFNAFGPILQPNVCVLLDVGTQPGPTSIYKLWKTFDLNSNVGGACGEIVALKGKYFRNLLNPLVAAQNFEYKISNILDKPLESIFGYITVLPGAFSAYRYIALQNNDKGEGPLKEYFKGETLHHSVDADLWTKNMYLAEDRILCWELVAKRGSAWLLHYQRSAYAVTDVPDGVADLISQRRRWLNGSFFAGLHASYHFGYLYRSDHTVWRKAWLHVELLYQTFQQLFAWFALANWYIIRILTSSLADPSFKITGIRYLNITLEYVYLGALVCCFLLALGNRPQGSRGMYILIMSLYAIMTVYMLIAAGVITYYGVENAKDAIEADGGKFSVGAVFGNATFRNIIISMVSTYGLYFFASLIFFDPAHMFTSFIQYLLLAPSWINVINVYSFCNVQDVTWGNRPEEKVSNDLGAAPTASQDGGKVEVAVPSHEQDINSAYDDALHVLSQKAPKEVKSVDLETRMTDSYRAIRTNVVLAWTLTNGALVAAILSTSAGDTLTTTRTNVYMAFLLYSVAGLAAFRFVGSTVYSIFWLFQN
ncbi:hypothetical protein JCM11491_007242 [Sporobolomyces phaffii]